VWAYLTLTFHLKLIDIIDVRHQKSKRLLLLSRSLIAVMKFETKMIPGQLCTWLCCSV